jgi:anti-anti-sigma factor
MNVVKLTEGTYMLELGGEITALSEDALTQAYGQACTNRCSSVVLDFGGMKHMNSAGASLLVKLSVEARRRRQSLAAIGLSQRYVEVFRLTGLDRAFGIHGSVAEALSQLGESRRGEGAETGAIESSQQPEADEGRAAAHWAPLVSKLRVPDMPAEAMNLNVEGRRVVGPVEGFGQMWQKTYRLRLGGTGTSPTQAIEVLKSNFPGFQPQQNRFYPSAAGIQPGEIVLINSSTPGGPAATGVLVLYADDESFTLMTPQGHPESGWVTFSAFDEDGCTVTQIQGLARANDPVYETAFRLVGSKFQERIWRHVLGSMATHLGVEATVDVQKACIDAKLQWSEVGNLWHNAQIRTVLYVVTTWPLRSIRKLSRRKHDGRENDTESHL